MTQLSQIPIFVEGAPGASSPPTVGAGLAAILNELATLLERLDCSGEAGAIDVRSLPMSPADIEKLKAALGEGEVDIRIQANGETHARETAIPGIWWTEYRDLDGALLAALIEVAKVPDIVLAGDEQFARGADRLRAQAAAHSAAPGESPHVET